MPASPEPSTDVATRTPAQELVASVRSPAFLEQVGHALPEGVTPARFVRVAITALMENADLAKLEPNSVFNALLKSAADGLLPDGRDAALVPFKGKAVYVPMIGGFRKIAGEHGWSLRATVVYEGDDFDYGLGERPFVHHKPAPLGSVRDKMIAVYAVGRELATGATEVLVMTPAEVEKVRKTSKQPDGELWKNWPERAWEKTAGRRLFKLLPLGDSERVRRVIAAEDLEPGQASELAYGPPGEGESSTRPEGAVPDIDPGGASSEPEASEPAEPPTPPAPSGFVGDEPPPDADLADEELDADLDRVIELEGSRHKGKTLGELATAGEKTYLKWLSSEAVEDEELRAAAGRVLGSIR